MTTPKISIIIPIYNSEKYLNRCLDALINQTFNNIEIICVNDGSTDNSLAILQEYEQADKRIKVYTQPNSGPAKARNTALSHTKAQFIMFCDADDEYTPTMCEEMFKAITDTKADWVMCNSVCYSFSGKPIQSSWIFNYRTGSSLQIKTDTRFENVWLWNKIFRKSLIDQFNIHFPDGHLSDDNIFVWSYAAIAQNIYYLDKKLYLHYTIPNSIMSTYRSHCCNKKDIIDHIAICSIYYDFLIEQNLMKDNSNAFNEILCNEIIQTWAATPVKWEIDFLTELRHVIQHISPTKIPQSIYKLTEPLLKNDFRTAATLLNKELKLKNTKRRTRLYSKPEIFICYYRYKIMSKLTWGKKRQHYKEKREKFHQQVRRLRALKK